MRQPEQGREGESPCHGAQPRGRLLSLGAAARKIAKRGYSIPTRTLRYWSDRSFPPESRFPAFKLGVSALAHWKIWERDLEEWLSRWESRHALPAEPAEQE